MVSRAFAAVFCLLALLSPARAHALPLTVSVPVRRQTPAPAATPSEAGSSPQTDDVAPPVSPPDTFAVPLPQTEDADAAQTPPATPSESYEGIPAAGLQVEWSASKAQWTLDLGRARPSADLVATLQVTNSAGMPLHVEFFVGADDEAALDVFRSLGYLPPPVFSDSAIDLAPDEAREVTLTLAHDETRLLSEAQTRRLQTGETAPQLQVHVRWSPQQPDQEEYDEAASLSALSPMLGGPDGAGE